MRPLSALALALVLAACDASAPPSGPVDLAAPWAEATPDDVGLDAVEHAVARLAAVPRARSLLAVRGGRLAVERYLHGADRETLHDVRSVTKTVVGMLTGLAIADGHLSLNTPIGTLLDGAADVSPAHAAIPVGALTTMTSGLAWNELGGPSYADWITSGDHLQYVLDRPVEHAPGTDFTYNSGAVHVLGVVLEEAVGEPLPAYADRVLFGPLGIGAREWEALSGGRVNGGSGLDLRARDLARLGQLILQDGRSGGHAVLPAGWVAEWTAPAQPWRASSDAIGPYTYGRLVWSVDGPPGAALAWGYGGQFIYVAPSLDLVLVATTDWRGVSMDGGASPLEAAVLDVLADLAAAAQ
ncbi:serine hydrolase domain-containing protein [Rubrivirga sp. IMCC43871]|uniref:serine hydrolase domain-containing protein n=1 Tax=Rubrivirga sp. IMCC43871 TaxID=3391575 RepID=UPI00398FCAC4